MSEFEPFLQDLSQLSAQLGLVVVGLLPGSGAVPVAEPGPDAGPGEFAGTGVLQRLHLRVYADENYVSRWDQFFGWPPGDPTGRRERLGCQSRAAIVIATSLCVA